MSAVKVTVSFSERSIWGCISAGFTDGCFCDNEPIADEKEFHAHIQTDVHKTYIDQHKAEKNQKVMCECGVPVLNSRMESHLKTKTHDNNMLKGQSWTCEICKSRPMKATSQAAHEKSKTHLAKLENRSPERNKSATVQEKEICECGMPIAKSRMRVHLSGGPHQRAMEKKQGIVKEKEMFTCEKCGVTIAKNRSSTHIGSETCKKNAKKLKVAPMGEMEIVNVEIEERKEG